MTKRDTELIHLRGAAIGVITPNSSSEAVFQNQTLRPILKLQNELLLAVFHNYAVKQKGVFFALPPQKKMDYIEHVIQRDIKFRNALKGLIIGWFTLAEYQTYIQNSSNLNKRMMHLLIERLKSQIQLFDIP